MTARLLLVALASSAFVASAPAALADAPVSLADPQGDAIGSAPDITTTVVSNDDSGNIRFRINIANQIHLARDSRLYVYIDADRDPATGSASAQGADYMLLVDGSMGQYGLSRWSEPLWQPIVPAPGSVNDWSGLTITLNKLDLGGTTAFNFFIRTEIGSANRADVAPATGTWTYALGAGGSLTPEVRRLTGYASSLAPRAGDRFQVSRITLTLEDGSTVAPERASCSAKIGATTLVPRGTCLFKIPRTARRKTMKVTVTAVYRGSIVRITQPVRIF
jgi:hypothetical protein